MEDFFKTVTLIIAVITGLLALGKGSLEFLKEYQTNKSVLSALLVHRRFWMAAGFAFIGCSLIIGGAWWAMSRTKFVLTVMIWDIQQDEKHEILETEQFEGSSKSGLPDQILKEIGTWITEQITKKYDLEAADVRVRVRVPADLRTGKITLNASPSGPLNTYVYMTEEGRKSRVPLDEQVLTAFGRDFVLELQRPGYETRSIPVSWNQLLDEDFTLKPLPIRIGIEELADEENPLTTWLIDYLTSNSRFSVKDPDTLKALQKKIKEEGEAIARNPAIQAGYRTSLGIDLIISCRYEKL